MTWETLWSVGRFDLRLTEEEFWGLVPRQFVALMERRHQAVLRHEFTAGAICSAVFNSRGVKSKPTDFMPSWKEKEQPERPWQEMRSIIMQAAELAGGAQ